MTRRPRIPGTKRTVALYVLAPIRDDDPPERKNALAIRNACATEGFCPCCGVEGELHTDVALVGLYHYVFAHEAWCAVVADGDAA